MNEYIERIKRRLPAGYVQLFKRDDDHESDNTIREADQPPATERPGIVDAGNSGDAIQPITRDHPATPKAGA